MELVKPKQLFTTAKTFYVSSESEPDENHIVVQIKDVYYCDCRDFFVRHLPLLGTPGFSLCKHGQHARVVEEEINYKSEEPKKKFAVFFKANSGTVYSSTDVKGTFDTITQAQKAIKRYGSACVNYFVEQVID